MEDDKHLLPELPDIYLVIVGIACLVAIFLGTGIAFPFLVGGMLSGTLTKMWQAVNPPKIADRRTKT